MSILCNFNNSIQSIICAMDNVKFPVVYLKGGCVDNYMT